MARNARVFDAPVEQTGPVPAFQVVEYEGEVLKTRSHFDEKTRTIVNEQVIISGGYMVHFPKGHSAFYESLEALEDAGLGSVVPLINKGSESEVNSEHEGRTPTVQRKIEKAS